MRSAFPPDLPMTKFIGGERMWKKMSTSPSILWPRALDQCRNHFLMRMCARRKTTRRRKRGTGEVKKQPTRKALCEEDELSILFAQDRARTQMLRCVVCSHAQRH